MFEKLQGEYYFIATNKVFFSHVPLPEITSAFYIKGFEKDPCVGNLQEIMDITGKRYIDQFDYVQFLNRA